VTLSQSGGGPTYNMTPGGTPPTYFASITASTFPYNKLFDIALPGSADVPAQNWGSALASGDTVSVTAPIGFNGGDTSFPNADLVITYGAVQSELLLVSFVDANGNGITCRMPPGTGSNNNF